MSSASEAKHTLDWLKWLVVVALAAAGIYLNMEYALTSLLVRALAESPWRVSVPPSRYRLRRDEVFGSWPKRRG